MAPLTVIQMLESLDEKDYNSVIDFIEYLSARNKEHQVKKDLATLRDIQELFKDDKGGYLSEEEMLSDLAAFRKEHVFE